MHDRINPAVQYSISGETAVVLDPVAGEYVVLNRVATRIWMSLLEGLNREAVVHALTSEYEVEEQRVRADLDVFVTSCRQRGWLESPVA